MGRLPIWAGLGLILPVLFATGCGKSGHKPVYQVEGKVRYLGKPTPGAHVLLHPAGSSDGVSETLQPHGEVKEDGSFRLSTYGQLDGAPAGTYDVTVIWRQLAKSGDEDVNLLPVRYMSAGTSKLRVEIKPSVNTLATFDLTR